jgi:hypothetical protein
MKLVLFGVAMLACAAPVHAQRAATGHPWADRHTPSAADGASTTYHSSGNCGGGATFVPGVSGWIVLPNAFLSRLENSTTPGLGVTPGAPRAATSIVGQPSSGIGSIGLSGVGRIERSGIGSMDRSGVGTIESSGIGSIGGSLRPPPTPMISPPVQLVPSSPASTSPCR